MIVQVVVVVVIKWFYTFGNVRKRLVSPPVIPQQKLSLNNQHYHHGKSHTASIFREKKSFSYLTFYYSSIYFSPFNFPSVYFFPL